MSGKAFLVACALLSVVSSANASVVIGSNSAVQGQATATGLAGTYYRVASGSTNFTIADTLAALGKASVTGTFKSTAINYAGGDGSSITSFLGSDGASYIGRPAAAGDLSDAIIDLSGYLYVAGPSTISFALSHDDSAQLKIANQTIVSANCCGTDVTSVTFGGSGYYAVDLIYSNTMYNGGTGGASFSLTENGSVLTAANLAQSVPEPASLALVGIALAGLAAVRRRA